MWARCVGREEQACDGLLELHGAGHHHHGAPLQIGNGYTPVLDCHTSHTACNFVNLQKLDLWTGKELEAEPEYIKNGDSTLVLVVPTKRCALRRSWSTPLLAVSLSVT